MKIALRKLRHPFRWLLDYTDECVLLGLALFLFVVAANTQTGWLYVVVAIVAGILGSGYLMPRATLRSLQARRYPIAPVFEGQEARVVMALHNPGNRERHLVLVEEIPPESLPLPEPMPPQRFLVEHLPAGGTVRLSYRLKGTLRGVHRLGPVRLRCATPLGLFPARREVPASGELVIYPVGPRLPDNPLASVTQRRTEPEGTLPRAGESSDFLGIRPYHPGEDIRRIHWLSSARAGMLMTREFREIGSQSMAVLIENDARSNFGRGAHTTLESAVRAAASLTDYARRVGIPLILMTLRGRRLATCLHPRGTEALEFLARIQPDGHLDWRELMGQASLLVPPRSHLFVLASTPLLEEAALEPLQRKRVRVTVILFSAPTYPGNGRLPGPQHALERYQASREKLLRAGAEVRVHSGGEDLLTTLRGAQGGGTT